jgi:hypothetical protein
LTLFQSERECEVVGNANSSNDIAAQLKPLAKTPVSRCIRHQRQGPFLTDPLAIARYVVTPTNNELRAVRACPALPGRVTVDQA